MIKFDIYNLTNNILITQKIILKKRRIRLENFEDAQGILNASYLSLTPHNNTLKSCLHLFKRIT